MDLTRFNEEQTKAITHEDGPLLIIAGAGTGKTTVITERIKYLIVEKGIKTSEILALTFTEKASSEMEERIDKIMPYGYTQMWIETFHSFCDLVLKENAINIGLNPNYRLMTEAESILFLRQHIFNLELSYYKPLGNPTKFLEALIEHFSRLRDEDISPSQYIKYAKEMSNIPYPISNEEKNSNTSNSDEIKKTYELANAYKLYEEMKAKEAVMDFSDLISNTLLLFRTRKNILKRYQEQFKYIMVDEFQDTNFAQNELAILLSGERKNITVVADDDQAIYRWRGAAVSNVLQFKQNFKGASITTLTKNYRSTQTILDASYKLIQNNNPNRLEVMEKVDKKLTAIKKQKEEPIELLRTTRSDEEAELIAKKILELTGRKIKHKLSDIAILVRANNHAQFVTRALSRYKIPYQFLGPGQLFHQEEIKDFIAYLKVLCNLEDSISLFRVLNMDIFDISVQEINYILNFSKRKNLPLFEILDKTEETFLKEETKEKIKNIQKIILKHMERAKKDSAGQILYYLLQDSGMYKTLLEPKDDKEEKTTQNIAKFFDRLKTHELEHEDSSIYAVNEWIDLMMQVGESPLAAQDDWKNYNAVNILTVHSSKGLEFPVVFLINLVENRFPTSERKEKIPVPDELVKEFLPDVDYHAQEERRLFYVGMTRARTKLIFTAAGFYGEGKRERKISRFVIETLGENAVKKNEELREVKQLSLMEIMKKYENTESLPKPINPFRIDYISYSHLQTFDICPLHFKAKYILNMPTLPSPALTFGVTIHNVLRDIYKLVKEKKTFSKSDFDELIKKNWKSEGYKGKEHEKEAFYRAKQVIKNYFEKYFDPETLPQAVELPFSFYVSRKNNENNGSATNNLSSQIKVVGKIDRIDMLPDGKIEIIDYKTGSIGNSSKNSYELQLGLYALAATKVNHPVFQKKPTDIKLTLFYVEDGEKITHEVSKSEIEKTEEKILEKIEQIETSNFSCSKSIFCNNCEYNMLCNVNS